MRDQSSVRKIIQRVAWYPPAETRVPLSVFIRVIQAGKGNFEQALCNYLGVDSCALGNSGRSLLFLLLKLLKEKSHDSRNEVLIPGYTCYSVAASVAKAGLKIRTYDIDSRTLNADIDSLRQAANDRTLAIISQHLFGIPGDLQKINNISKSAGAYHIEDAAQSLGGMIGGRFLGTMGDFGLYSFGRGKALPVGCGGAIVGKYPDVIKQLTLHQKQMGYLHLAKFLITRTISMPAFYWLAESLPLGLGETVFHPDFDISAMPVLVNKFAKESLPALVDLNNHRRQIAELYKEGFTENAIVPVPDNAIPVYTRFPLMAGRSALTKKVKRLGVRRMYPKAVFEETTIRPFFAEGNALSHGASRIAQDLITLPTHKGINDKLALDIIKKVKAEYAC